MTRRRRVIGFGVLALVLLFLVVKIVSPRSGPEIARGFSDRPFGPFAGYAWIGNVHSVGGSFTVPRIARGSALGEAGSWIGVQGAGPPTRFVQIGAVESRFWSSREQRTVDGYATFWSDVAHRFKPKPLFRVSPGDTLSAGLTLANKQWTLAIRDDTSHKKARFSMGDEADAPFNQAEWTQEDPGTENDHVRYPQMAAPVFQHLTINSTEPAPVYLYSQWMSVNHTNLAPTTPHNDSFTLERAPAVGLAGLQYLRLSAVAVAAFDLFETERTKWNARTPYQQIATASSRLITASQKGIRSVLAARWPKEIRSLIRSGARMTGMFLEDARPPTVLTQSSLTDWNSKLTEASERAAPTTRKLSLALGLPAFGPSYHR